MVTYNELVNKFVTKIPGTERHTFSGFTYVNANGKGTVYPRIMELEEKGGWCFYDKRDGLPKAHVRIDDFVERFSRGDVIGVGGYLEDGTVSSITFEKKELFRPTKEFLEVVNSFRSNKGNKSTHTFYKESVDAENESTENDTKHNNRRKLTLNDLEEKLARQRETGIQGEAAAFRYECFRLHALGCSNPIAHIKDLTKDDVGAGYDLRSEFNGEVRHIEVKASVTSIDSFFISENEKATLTGLAESAFIYLVLIDKIDAKNSKVIREIRNPFAGDQINTEPVAYRATLKNTVSEES